MDIRNFSRRCPSLFHLTTPPAWESIQKHGLFCAQALLAQAGIVSDNDRSRIFDLRRKGSYQLQLNNLGLVTLRDQKPLFPGGLQIALQNSMTVQQWVDLINERVFFHIKRANADRLLKAAATSGETKCLIEIETELLLRAHFQNAEVTTFNVGNATRKAKARNSDSFQSFATYPINEVGKVKELTILGNVDDLMTHIINVQMISPAPHGT